MRTDWIVVPYGPDHRRTMEELAGSTWDPENGIYGLDWNKLRNSGSAYGLRPACDYGYNGVYLEVYGLPDGRIMIKRDDRYSCYSKFMVFESREEYDVWAKSTERYEIDPETGRLAIG